MGNLRRHFRRWSRLQGATGVCDATTHSPRVSIVTGGASGIGRALSAALVERGGCVVIADLDETGAAQAVEELSVAGPGTLVAASLDVREAHAVAELVQRTHREQGRLDMLFNNAGIGVGGYAQELGLEHWERAIDVNLRGVVHGVHAAYPLMIEQGQGHIINTASMAGLVPSPGLTPYAMTKHAVVGLSLSLRVEAAAYGVRVTAVCPGVVETPILDQGGPDDLPKPALSGHTREVFRHL